MTLNYVTLILDLYDGDGNPASQGWARLTPSAQLTDTANNQLVTQAPMVAQFRPGLTPPEVLLLATDNGTLNPAGWGWTISFTGVSGNPASFNFFLPYASGATQYLSGQAPVATALAMGGYLPLAGGTMTGAITLAGNPAAALQAAPKQYVDDHAGITDWINVVTIYGADPTGTNLNDAAIANATAAATAAGVPLYFPAGTYKISAAVNWKLPYLVVYADGGDRTYLKQMTANTPVIEVAGQNQDIGGFSLVYPSQQTSAQTGAIAMTLGDNTVGPCFNSRYHDINFAQVNTAMAIVATANGGFSSCIVENLDINGYSYSALNMQAASGTGAGACTGSVWNNIYIHNNYTGSNAQCTYRAVEFKNFNETIINQLNVEHGDHFDSDVMAFEQCGSMVINSLHFEALDMSGSSSLGFILVNNSASLIINGLSIVSPILTSSVANPVVRFNTAAANVTVNGYYEALGTGNITGDVHPWADFGSTAGCTMLVTSVLASLTTALQINGAAGSSIYVSQGALTGSGTYLCAPNQYAPGARTEPSVSSTTLAAFDSGVICTNSFTAPASGAVVVTLSAVMEQSTGADEVMLALAAVGTVTPVIGFTQTIALNGTTTPDQVTADFYVTGLTPGTSYQFDLLGAATSTTTVKIFAQGLTSTTLGNVGGPVVMTVQAV
jgi:hypothetical protein